jgi:hypothetical protein
MTAFRPLLLALLPLVLLCGPAMGQGAPADSLRRQEARVRSLQDSLTLGISQLQESWSRAEREQTDSLKYEVQAGLARGWKDWALQAAPRRGMSGDDIIQLAELHAWLNRFDMEGCYNEQLECYKRAMVMPGCEEKALRLLHAEYMAAGFAPGMLQTGQRLLELDKAKAMELGVARSMALAYYFVGDRREALRWIKRHLRKFPDDPMAQDLRRRIRKLKKRDS